MSSLNAVADENHEEEEKTETLVIPGIYKERNQHGPYLTFKLYKKWKIKIYKPLISLKIIQFLWFASSISMMTFFSVFFKQRGISVKELSIIFTVAPILIFLCSILLGVLADKIGRAKPILLFNVVLSIIFSLVLIALPSAVQVQKHLLIFQCIKPAEDKIIPGTVTCGVENKGMILDYCTRICSRELNYSLCNDTQYLKCLLLEMESSSGLYYTETNNSITITEDNCDSGTFTLNPRDFYNQCDQFINDSCLVSCTNEMKYRDYLEDSDRNVLVLGYMTVQFIFLITYTNIFRFLDVTTMVLVKQHNSDYGSQRFWSILGNTLGPLMSSVVIHLSALFSGENNYSACFYSYVFLNVIIAVLVHKIDICNLEPNEKFFKKILILFKNLDALFFVLILLVCGTSWGFNIMFKSWYFHDLGAQPYLTGVVETANNIFGLPFLFTSKWYLKHMSYSTVFLLALLARAISSFGYSFLIAVWPAVLLSLTEVLSYHLFWVGVVNYCHEIAPKGLISTVNTAAGVIHFTIGRATGSVIGGMIMSAYGGRMAFRVIGSMCLSLAVLYFTYIMFKKRCIR